MRQVWISRTGPPETLELREARNPLPGAGEIRIRVEAAGVNFADVMGRFGLYPDLPPLPVVPGYEVARRVDAVGPNTFPDWVGRDVLAMTRFGGYSDVVCVPERQAFTIDYRREDFEARVREITGGRGTELVLDAVGAASFRKSYRCLAPTGRLGLFGLSAAAPGKMRRPVAALRAGLSTLRLRWGPLGLMNENKGVFGVNLGHLWNETERVGGWMETLLDHWKQGALRPVVAASFPFERAVDAHHYLQDRRNLGKVLLVSTRPAEKVDERTRPLS